MVLRSFGVSRSLLVATTACLDKHGRPRTLADVATMPALSMFEHDGAQIWEMLDPQGRRDTVEVSPRLVTGDFTALMHAVIQGAGIALLPEEYCAPAIARGQIEWVLPEWTTAQGTLHFIYPSRRGLLPAVRAFVDFLAERLPDARRAAHEVCVKANAA
jgi:DNA-binding transcriptional LysR family regulator